MWPQLVNICLGIWLMAAPAVLGSAAPVADNDHVVGPVAAALAAIAVSAVTRPVRRINVPVGAWLAVSPWVLPGASWPDTVNNLLVGLALAGFACMGKRAGDNYGGGWSSLWSAGGGPSGASG